MPIEIGQIDAIYRYPVKSMRGERLTGATLGWHGLAGDRRLAFGRLEDRGGFPWVTASRVPELLLFTPQAADEDDGEALPTHVLAPDGRTMPLFGDALAAEIGERCGAPVKMMRLRQGIFDDACLSVITSETVREVGRLSGMSADVRRFRPNVVVRANCGVPFEEDDWVGGVLTFGDGDDAPAVAVTASDVRCAMVNLDPETAMAAPQVLKAVVRANQNHAGIYATVTRVGRLAVGQKVVLYQQGTHSRLTASCAMGT